MKRDLKFWKGGMEEMTEARASASFSTSPIGIKQYNQN